MFARAPRQAVPTSELRRLVGCALILYAVGGVASLTHHPLLAGLVYGAGIVVSALAAWLSRGQDHGSRPTATSQWTSSPRLSPMACPGWTGRASSASSATTQSAGGAILPRHPDTLPLRGREQETPRDAA